MHRQKKARSHFGVGRSGGSRIVFVASIRFKIFLSTTFGPDRSLPFGPKRCITPAGCLGIKLSMPIQTSTVPGFQPAKSTDVAYLPPVTLIWPCVFVNFSVGSGSRIMPECCKSKSITVPSGRSTVPSQKISGLIAVAPKDSKEARASAVTPMIESGNVYIPATAAWKDVFLLEMSIFPKGKNDDQVDSMTQALLRFDKTSKRQMRFVLHEII